MRHIDAEVRPPCGSVDYVSVLCSVLATVPPQIAGSIACVGAQISDQTLTVLRHRLLAVYKEALLGLTALAILANCDLAPLQGCLTRIPVESLQLADSHIVCQAAQLARALLARPTPALLESAAELLELLSDAAKSPLLLREMHPIVLASIVEVGANVETGFEGRALELLSLLGPLQSTVCSYGRHSCADRSSPWSCWKGAGFFKRTCTPKLKAAHRGGANRRPPILSVGASHQFGPQTGLVPARGRQVRLGGRHPWIRSRADRGDDEE
jgi:hypothetical protein